MTNLKLLSKIAEQELHIRENVKPPNVLVECFAQQLEFIKDEAKRKILCLPRRSGKSTAIAIYLIWIALTEPGAKLLYVNTTKSEAKNVMWHDIFENIFIRLSIGAELIDGKNEIRFQNGSIIYMHGVDSTPKEMNKLRGKKYKLAVVDECQSYTQDLKQLVNQVMGPTLADANATICMIGTPSNQMGEHHWWTINKPNSPEKGWKFFTWSWKDNPHVKDKMQQHVDQLLLDNPLNKDTDWFKQEYLGEWVVTADARVYKSNDHNIIPQLPDGFLKGARYILAMDLGYYDATAFVIAAYNKHFNDTLYIIESKKQAGMTITAVAQEIKALKIKYQFSQHIVDAANSQAVEEMRQIHNLPLVAAEKLGKEGHIALLNSDFITNNIKIVAPANAELIKELQTLIWDPKALLKGKHKEDATKENHLTDALLYCHHASRHYWFSPPKEIIDIEESVIQSIEKQFSKKANRYFKKPWWEDQDEGL